MHYSRRDLGLLLPAFAAGQARGQKSVLPSQAFPYEKLPVHAEGSNELRPVMDGDTHSGVRIEVHETELPPGGAPHPPHHHVHEEMILVREGIMRVTIAGSSTDLGPGSVAYVASNEEHGWSNVGAGRARYFVLAVGRDN